MQKRQQRKPKNSQLSWSSQAHEALRIMNDTRDNLFLTGRAGTGKSTLLTEFRKNTKKRIAVLAPTGVAAVNVAGQTIHSFCGFKPDITLKKVKRLGDDNKRVRVLNKLDAIVIDEISMTRADILDCFEKFLRINRRAKNEEGKNISTDKPFGGLQIIFIGDLYQLPPVVTTPEKKAFESLYESPYFFSAKCFVPELFHFIELEKVYRQLDNNFIRLLNTIRNNSVTEKELGELNIRYKKETASAGKFIVCLTSTNAKANEINTLKLAELPDDEYISRAVITGRFDRSHMPTDEDLCLKVGAQVMLLNNDTDSRWANGTMGIIETVNDEGVTVKLENGEIYPIVQNEWDIFEYNVDDKGGLRTKSIGSFKQYPLKLAWAITIHKSQGKTFDEIIIDLGRGTFAHGQLYVALSRCRTLEGITLRQPLMKSHVIMDWKVVKFVTSLHYAKAEEKCSIEERTKIIKKAIKDEASLSITYLKNNDEKSRRIIEPQKIGEMEYKGKKYLGVEAYCQNQKAIRTFRVDRIVEIEEE